MDAAVASSGHDNVHGDDHAIGAQTVTRALRVLQIIAQYNPIGITFTSLAQSADIKRFTTYRLVNSLLTEGYTVRHPLTRKYDIGPAAFRLGLTTST